MKIHKAIIPVAGLGTRFLPATKAQPKEMLPIVDKPAVQYIIEEAVDSGIEEILIITGRNKKSIEDHFDRSIELEMQLESQGKLDLLKEIRRISNMADIHYIRQKEPNGLGHALYCARSFIGNEPFAVLLGDNIIQASAPCLKQIMEVYDQYNATVLGVQEVAKENAGKYGIIEYQHITDSIYRVKGLIEKPAPGKAPSSLAVMGRYIITPEIFEILAKTKPGSGGEIQLTDALDVLADSQDVYAFRFEGKVYDVGDKEGFLKATVDFALRRADLRESFFEYLMGVVSEEIQSCQLDEAAAAKK